MTSNLHQNVHSILSGIDHKLGKAQLQQGIHEGFGLGCISQMLQSWEIELCITEQENDDCPLALFCNTHMLRGPAYLAFPRFPKMHIGYTAWKSGDPEEADL